MYKRCVTEGAAQRQRMLEDCLLKKMQDIPYQQIFISDLCEEVGCSRKAFYRYYNGKDDCLNALIDRTLMGFASYQGKVEGLKGDYPADLAKYLKYLMEQKELLDALIKNELSRALLERTLTHVLNEEYGARRWFKADNTKYSEEILLFAFSGIISLILNWHSTGYKRSFEEMIHILTQLITSPLATNPHLGGVE